MAPTHGLRPGRWDAGQHRSVQKPMGASGGVGRQRLNATTDSPAEQSPEVVETAGGLERPVNAGDRGDGPSAAGEGNASKGVAPSRKGAGAIFGSCPRAPKRGEPHGRLRGATNPRDARGDVPRGTTPAAEETVEAGRNGKDGTSPGLATPGRRAGSGPSGSGRSGMTGGGANDEPHERSRAIATAFGLAAAQTARTGASEKEAAGVPILTVHSERGG
jgi:hypothetical protein